MPRDALGLGLAFSVIHFLNRADDHHKKFLDTKYANLHGFKQRRSVCVRLYLERVGGDFLNV
jgi:hypothetical protein